MFVVFDLDGTLALNEHRTHFLRGEGPKNWDAFNDACDLDDPCIPLIKTLKALQLAGHLVQIWTGRDGRVAAKTREWMNRHNVGDVSIKARPVGDHRDDTILKADWADEHLRTFGKPVDLVFEDRKRMVDMWRGRGVVCCQVAPGDF